MLTIYTPQNGLRLTYIATHLFRNILGTDYAVTNDIDFFLQQTGPCINYSNENLEKGIQIIPYGLLSETGIRCIDDFRTSEWNGLFCFFSHDAGDISFDIFSASFFLLSRYEEYFPKQLDAHERYNPLESLAVKNGFLETPIVDRWVYKLRELFIEQGYSASTFKLRDYRTISTFDIDHPFSYRNKGLLKNELGALRDLYRKDFKGFSDRLRTICHLQEDPYFKALLWIDEFQQKMGKPYYLFILNAPYEKYGRTTIYPLRRYYRFLNRIKTATIGLHPSYSASFDLEKIEKEKRFLEKKIHKEVVSNRQHYLRIQVPKSYLQLNQLKFEEDFSLGYSALPGFRAGTAIPFFFYDLEKEICTTLLIRPTIVMDATLITHMGLNPEEALSKMKKLADACKKSGGDFVMLWHNSTLIGNPEANPWFNVFINSYQYALSLENANFGG